MVELEVSSCSPPSPMITLCKSRKWRMDSILNCDKSDPRTNCLTLDWTSYRILPSPASSLYLGPWMVKLSSSSSSHFSLCHLIRLW